jgi:outer membrane receptor protein involved in Fe transport
MRLKLLLVASAMILPSLAMAQTAPAQAPAAASRPVDKSAPTAVEGVVVTGDANAMRTSIDRRSYSVANDLSARTGSIADALRNIPSVEVDVQGNVSLRGDANVTIMIDGKPSGQFSGEGKADALQAMPADQIERVEVMTNPSAAYRPDGSAGIINLITKKTQKPGVNGSVRLNVTPDGRYNTGISATRRAGKLTLSGDAGYRHDTQEARQEIDRATLDTASGKFLVSSQDAEVENKGGMVNLRGGVDYDLDKQNRISGEIRYRGMSFDTDIDETYAALNAAGAPSRAYVRTSTAEMARQRRHQRRLAPAAEGRRARADQPCRVRGHQLPARRQVPDQELAGRRPVRDHWRRRRPDAGQFQARLQQADARQFQAEDGRRFRGPSNKYDNDGATGPAPNGLVVDPSRTNRYDYDQDVYAAYVTYERPFGDFTVQGGLRAEQVQIKIDDITHAVKGDNDYFKLYPTLHTGYKLSENQSLSANFARRVQRPGAQDLLPYRVYQDPLNYRQGNPNLKPQQTDSYELAWQYRKGPAYYLATAYYRESSNGVTDVVSDLGGGVLLTTRENLATSRNGGLELVANGRLSAQADLQCQQQRLWNEIDASSLGFTGTRSLTAVSGRANLNYQATPKDFLQINAFSSGKRLTPQGHREPFQMVNLGYRRKVSDKLSFVVTAQDVLELVRGHGGRRHPDPARPHHSHGQGAQRSSSASPTISAAASRVPSSSTSAAGRWAKALLVAPDVQREEAGGGFRRHALDSRQRPARLLVEAGGAGVADGAGQPRGLYTQGQQAVLGVGHQRRRRAGSAGLGGDVELIKLVVLDQVKAQRRADGTLACGPGAGRRSGGRGSCLACAAWPGPRARGPDERRASRTTRGGQGRPGRRLAASRGCWLMRRGSVEGPKASTASGPYRPTGSSVTSTMSFSRIGRSRLKSPLAPIATLRSVSGLSVVRACRSRTCSALRLAGEPMAR